jgi:hypothetical protein
LQDIIASPLGFPAGRCCEKGANYDRLAVVAERPVLVIDAEGRVLAEDRNASRRLAGRAGRWRMLASTGDLIILSREPPEGAPVSNVRVALSGEIDGTGGLCDVMGFIHQSQWSGALHTIDGKAHRTIWFKRGDIRTCGSNQPADRLGELLFRYGRITRADLDRALQRLGPDQRIGQLLVESGIVSSHDVFTFVRKQVEEVFFSVLGLRSGSFYFERSQGDEKLPDLGLSTQNLLMEGTRQMDEMAYFQQKIPSMSAVPRLRSNAPAAPPEDPNPGVVLELIDGEADVASIARQSRLGEFEAMRALFQLSQGGYIEILSATDVQRRPLSRPPSSEKGGLTRLVEVFNEVLVKIHATLAASNKGERFRRDLAAFFRGATTYSDLFAGVQPGPDGRLPADLIFENLERTRVSDRGQYLHQALNELLFFLVFTFGEAMGPEEEKELTRRLNELLRDLSS